MRTLLGDHFLTLTQSIDLTKFPLYQLDNSSPEYQLGYILYTQRYLLRIKPHLLMAHFKSLKESPQTGFHLSSYREYLLRVRHFYEIFKHVLSSNTDKSFKDYKDLIAYGINFNPASTFVKQLASSVSTIPQFLQSIEQHEDTILHLSIPTIGSKLPPSPTSATHPPPTPPRVEGRRAHQATKPPPVKWPIFCTNPGCARATHRTLDCVEPCNLVGCLSGSFPHAAKTCHILHDKTSAAQHYSNFKVLSSRRHPYPVLSSNCTRPSRTCDSHGLWSRSPSTLPTITFDTGANVLLCLQFL